MATISSPQAKAKAVPTQPKPPEQRGMLDFVRPTVNENRHWSNLSEDNTGYETDDTPIQS